MSETNVLGRWPGSAPRNALARSPERVGNALMVQDYLDRLDRAEAGPRAQAAYRANVEGGTGTPLRRHVNALMADPTAMAFAEGFGFSPATVGRVPPNWLHGTSGQFNRFDLGRAGQISSGAGEGVWLTQNRNYASEYAQNAAGVTGGSPNIMNVRAAPRNPLVVRWDWDAPTPVLRDLSGRAIDAADNADVIRLARRNGHDSVYWVDSSFTDDGPTLTALVDDILDILP